MENFIVAVILVSIASGIVFYLWRMKRRGGKCVGCPYAKTCKGGCHAPQAEKTKDGEDGE